jgi:acetyl esterase/lipase
MTRTPLHARFGTTRWVWWSSLVAGFTGALVVLFSASARPSALVLRYLIDRTSRTTRTPGPIAATDVCYGRDEPDARLDVYFPSHLADGARAPTIVWIHGGAWISGTKEADAPYFAMLARGGFTVVAVEYSRAPDTQYPTPILQINDALAYVLRNAERFHVDTQQVVIAGDSAGAQMASQIAVLVTSGAYAVDVGINPSLRPDQLRGTILFCGVYDAAGIARHSRAVSNTALRVFTRSVLWAYTGSRERDSATLRQMSTIDHATAEFPTTYISGGNADPLTDAHSRPFAARLAELGVEVTASFYAPDRVPALGHEYQFRVESADGREALQAVLAFARRVTQTPR